jgi:FlaA1/EpsC-like NDP-sugar epimerase
MSKFLYRYSEKFVSKWLILSIDLFICVIAFSLAAFLRFNLDFKYISPSIFKYHLALIFIVKASAFLYFKTFSGVIRHSGIEDTKLLFKACFIAFVELVIISTLTENKWRGVFDIPTSILVIDFFVSLFALVFARLLIKSTYERLIRGFKTQKFVIIYGAGHLGRITCDTLRKDKKHSYVILCFIDDNPTMIGLSIEGVKVLSKGAATRRYLNGSIYKDQGIEVIFAIQTIMSQRKREVIDELMKHDVQLRVVPPVRQWIDGTLSSQQIEKIKIEDLLDREPITINNKLVDAFLKDKVILITGAAGSIGSEIVRQALLYKPKKIILLDQAESPLYDLETELYRTGKVEVEAILVSETRNVVNKQKIREVFERERPQIVFHAAAYKHVPLMERNPFKAFEVNVIGTQNVADLASEFGAEKFVMISTDKAVNPTNVMGATKRLAEKYVHGLNSHHTNRTRFIITRFGNVLGSNGSVIPLFKKQIEAGGPMTVTHEEIIRYFMTIPEACQLVLEAGTMGKGGEIFVFDMGEPVKIIDLAKRMIKLSGLTEGKDIDITITGLRPGEKLYEELLSTEESTIPTYHPKIMMARVISDDYEYLKSRIDGIKPNLSKTTREDIVRLLKELVEEYISQNSRYESLDNELVVE